jgi:hypothetical protein
MRQHAAKALHHPVPIPRRAHVRAFEHAVPVQVGTIRVHHVEVRGEPPCPQNNCPGQESVLLAGLLMHCNHASNPAVFDDEIVRRHGGDPVCQTLGQRVLIQRVPQPATTAGRSVPAWHAVTFLLIEAIPLHAACDPPLVEVRIRVFNVKARPLLIRGTLTPRNPVIEGQVR